MRTPQKLNALSVLIERKVPIATILDVGVMSGTPELITSFPTTKHVLFEPVSEFEDLIRKTYASTPYELINTAISNTTGTTTLHVRSVIDGGDISHSHMIDGAGLEGGGQRVVPMTTLDDHLAKFPQPGPYFLKIDIDGHELRVLEGARQTLENTSVVMIETPVHELTARIKVLEDAGFILFDLIEPCYYDDTLWQCDALMVKSNIRWTLFDTGEKFDISKYYIWQG